MTLLGFAAVVVVCITQVACVYLIAERWYAHRSRLIVQMSESAQETLKTVRDETEKLVRQADAHIQRSMETHAEEVKRLRADVAELDRVQKIRHLGGRS